MLFVDLLYHKIATSLNVRVESSKRKADVSVVFYVLQESGHTRRETLLKAMEHFWMLESA